MKTYYYIVSQYLDDSYDDEKVPKTESVRVSSEEYEKYMRPFHQPLWATDPTLGVKLKLKYGEYANS